MPRRFLVVGALAVSVVLLGFGTPSSVLRTTEIETSTRPLGSMTKRLAPADTIHASAQVGTPLVRSLPADWNGAPVTSYAIVKGPALCGIAGRSFTWITRGTAPGTYDVRLQATHPDAAADTLVLRIEVQS